MSKDFALPPRYQSHDIKKYQKCKWSLLSKEPPGLERIVIKCTSCSERYFLSWERNLTTLKFQYESAHNLILERDKMEAKNSNMNDESRIFVSSLIGSSGGNMSFHAIDKYLTTNDH